MSSAAAAAAGGSEGGDGGDKKKGKEAAHDDGEEPFYEWLDNVSDDEYLDLENKAAMASPLKRKSTSISPKPLLLSQEHTFEDLEYLNISPRELHFGDEENPSQPESTDKVVEKGSSAPPRVTRTRKPKMKKLSELGSGRVEVAPPPRRRGRPKKAAKGGGGGSGNTAKDQPDGKSTGQEDETREWINVPVHIPKVECIKIEVVHDKEREMQEMQRANDKCPKN